jgi:hypothetical protein
MNPNLGHRFTRLSSLAVLALGSAFPAHAGLINGGFETTPAVSTYIITDQANVPGWRTTASDGQIEIWKSSYSNTSGGAVPAYEGTRFAEINANMSAGLYQDVSGISAGSIFGFQFAHRGRAGTDKMRLSIVDLGGDGIFGSGDDVSLFAKDYSTGNAGWGFYTSAAEGRITALGHLTRFSYSALSTASSASIGNFLDAVDISVRPAQIPEPGTVLLVALGLAGLTLARRNAGVPARRESSRSSG